MNKTEIQWTNLTWNPASGCQKVSAGCKFCYAHTLAENKRGTKAFPNGFDLTIRPHKLVEPIKVKAPSKIFVNSMSDLFWEKIPNDYRHQIVDVMERTPQHQYQVLTKRPEAMLAFSKERKLPANFWAGVTIEDNKALYRLDLLKAVDARIRFISAEPLLSGFGDVDLSGVHWLIGGGESGAHLGTREMQDKRALVYREGREWFRYPEREQWVRDLLRACRAAGTAFFFKQWGGVLPKSGGWLLDGVEYKEFPDYERP